MTSVTTPVPGPARTRTGALLPLVALPQGRLLTINERSIPLIRNALGAGVHFKPLRLDLEAGVWVVLGTFAPGASIPLHYHTNAVDAWTISGCWYYEEYPDQRQTAGSYLYEPGASVHTFTCASDNTEDTVVLFHVTGGNINFHEDGTFHSILDAAVVRHLTDTLAQEQGLGPINYIGAGFAGLTTEDA